MKYLLELLAVNTVTMSLLIICFLAITPGLAKKYRAKWIYYAWLLIVIGLIIPFRLQFVIILQHKVKEPDYVYEYTLRDDAGDITKEQAEWRDFPWYQIAGALWLSGVISFIIYQGIKQYRFIKTLNRWGEQDNIR